MPNAYIKKLADEGKGTVDSLEKKWEKAKSLAKEQGHGEEYDYITGIFKKMVNESILSFRNFISDKNKLTEEGEPTTSDEAGGVDNPEGKKLKPMARRKKKKDKNELEEEFEMNIKSGKLPDGNHIFKYKVSNKGSFLARSAKSRKMDVVKRGSNFIVARGTASQHMSLINSLQSFPKLNGEVEEYFIDENTILNLAATLSKSVAKKIYETYIELLSKKIQSPVNKTAQLYGIETRTVQNIVDKMANI